MGLVKLHASRTLSLVLLGTGFLSCTSDRDPEKLPAASELVESSIAHHDPQGLWHRSEIEIKLHETGPGGRDRRTTVTFAGDNFRYRTLRDGNEVSGSWTPNGCEATVNGSDEIDEETLKKYRLTCEGLNWWRDYYAYLYGLPMKLEDPGTQAAPEVERAEWQGAPALSVRVTYDEEVGKDIWDFYFDPTSRELVGYRFFHDEAANDGEYILLEGEAAQDDLRLPKTRTWYTNSDDRLLGTDTITSIKVSPLKST